MSSKVSWVLRVNFYDKIPIYPLIPSLHDLGIYVTKIMGWDGRLEKRLRS